jgi:ribonuclease HII
MIPTPTFAIETQLWQQGYRATAGIDEAGRGALAGPVVAAAVIVPPFSNLTGVWTEVRDSKQLSAVQRAALEVRIQDAALAWGIGCVDSETIDRIGIAPATKQAMMEAVRALHVPPDYLLIDWVRLDRINLPQQNPSKADTHIVSVAAASILAKVYRDRWMTEASKSYPLYNFASHKGYGTAAHLTAITQHGACSLHRQSFAPIHQQSSLLAISE